MFIHSQGIPLLRSIVRLLFVFVKFLPIFPRPQMCLKAMALAQEVPACDHGRRPGT